MEIGSTTTLARALPEPGAPRHGAAATKKQAAAETPPEAGTPEQVEARWGGGTPGRAHVQQALHRLERLVRAEVEAELAPAGPEDAAYAAAVRDLETAFAGSLREAFHQAGRGNEFDRAALLGGIATAVRDLSTGLQELRASLMPEEPPAVEPPAVEPPVVEPPADGAEAPVAPAPEREAVAPAAYAPAPSESGALLSLSA